MYNIVLKVAGATDSASLAGPAKVTLDIVGLTVSTVEKTSNSAASEVLMAGYN